MGDPPATVVLTAGCPALGVGHPGRKSKNIPIFAKIFWEVPLVATEVSEIFAEGGSSLLGRPKERSTCRKKISCEHLWSCRGAQEHLLTFPWPESAQVQ